MRSAVALVMSLAVFTVALSAQSPQPRSPEELREALRRASALRTLLIQRTQLRETTLGTAKPITARFTNAPARDVLQFLGKHASVDVRFGDEITATTPINVYAHEADAADLFNFVLDAANLTVTILDDKTLLIEAKVR